MIGSNFAGYKILSRIGGGNTGLVYKAYDPKAGRPVAVKVLPDDILVSKETKARFLRESRAAIILQHPAISKVFEVGDFRGYNYIAMEYVDGKSFSEILKRFSNGVSLNAFFGLMLPVIDGIGYAHERGLVHRDIKPENLKITLNGQAKVLDFGLVKFLDRDDSSGDESFQTMKGMVLGSACYMSPEQARGEKLDARSDVFSIGILMYEFLCGKNPFAAVTPFQSMDKILNTEPVSLELIKPEIPLPLSQIVLRCLSKDMTRRFPDGSALYTAINGIKV